MDPALVAETARREKVRLCGLSALMTTTVAGMEETIRALRAAAPDCRVMVGGAVLTPEYAAQIGADWYAKDAMGSVHIAQELFGDCLLYTSTEHIDDILADLEQALE